MLNKLWLTNKLAMLAIFRLKNGHYCTFVPPLGLGLGFWLVLSCISSWLIKGGGGGTKVQ